MSPAPIPLGDLTEQEKWILARAWIDSPPGRGREAGWVTALVHVDLAVGEARPGVPPNGFYYDGRGFFAPQFMSFKRAAREVETGKYCDIEGRVVTPIGGADTGTPA